MKKKRRFQPLPDGRYAVNLPTEERVLLRILPNQLLESLTVLSDALSGGEHSQELNQLHSNEEDNFDLGLQFDDLSFDEGNSYKISDFDIPESIKRLIPKAYPRDEIAQENFESLTTIHLLKEHIARLTLLAESVSNQYLTVDELNEWMVALNNLRLVLGTSIGVTENSAMPDIADPFIPQWVAYGYLSELVEDIVATLFGEIPDTDEVNDPSLPEDPWGEAPGGLRWDGTMRPGT